VLGASRGTPTSVLAGVPEIEERLDEALRLREQAAALRIVDRLAENNLTRCWRFGKETA
jgi:hypothetical protein